MARRWSAAALLIIFAFASRTTAAAGIDVVRWLDRPGVRMLAVEFYATWCKPCMAAVPKWKALHEKYAADGLRLVVIATQDPAGCANLGWSPDELICDEDGSIARAFGADGALPAAFLWSWDGRLLVKKGHVEEVRSGVEAWMARAPRVQVSVDVEGSAGIKDGALRDLVSARLQDVGKLRIVAGTEEQAKLDKLKAESLKARYDDRAQCEIGKELPANGLVSARIAAREGLARLSLSLFSAEKGCLVAATVLDWRPAQASQIIAEAVAELVQKLRGDVAGPRSGALARSEARDREVIVDATPKIAIRSAGLSDLTIEAERLVEAAQQLQASASATYEAKRDAWCKLAALPKKRNPYQQDARKACSEWKSFIVKRTKQLENLTKDYNVLLQILQLKGRSDAEKRAAIDRFAQAYRDVADDRVSKVLRLVEVWPVPADEVLLAIDRRTPEVVAWERIFFKPEARGSFPKRQIKVETYVANTTRIVSTYVLGANGLPERADVVSTKTWNEPKGKVDEEKYAIQYRYDARNYLVSTESKLNVTTYQLGLGGRVTATEGKDPQSGGWTKTSIQLDEKGRPWKTEYTTSQGAKGATETRYDDQGRVLEIKKSGVTNGSSRYVYNNDGTWTEEHLESWSTDRSEQRCTGKKEGRTSVKQCTLRYGSSAEVRPWKTTQVEDAQGRPTLFRSEDQSRIPSTQETTWEY